jgi:DNA-binding transcriptional MerR regulator
MILSTTQPDVKLDGRYSIGETCRHLGIKSRHTLRKYTELGEIKSRPRQGGKTRFYLGSEILRFWQKNT